ncbi:MAG: ribosomal RNA small subunit methyltransferase A [Clostridia bacterium]|nr:ribosomal RNA small subunit methyltransferase A [Clostridia bacterium]
MLKEQLQKNNFTFKKSLGQNFLSDDNLLRAIVCDAGIDQDSVVLEIGAGAGTLTKRIAETARKVYAVEIDNRLQPLLTEQFKDQPNVQFIFGDVMKIFDQVVQKIAEPFFVVANIPYYLTTELALMVAKCPLCKSATLTIQKEVAYRLASQVGGKDYGSVSVVVQSVADVDVTRVVDRKMFMPQPDVDSAVIRMDFDRAKNGIEDFDFFMKVVKACFAMRRKTLNNNLKNSFNFSCTMEELLQPLGISPSARAETLTVHQFVELSNRIKNCLIKK